MKKTKNNSEDVMFLFGAGVSIPLGIPAMKGIYRAFMDKKQSNISTKNKKTCEFFTKDMGVDHDLEEFLLAANNIIEFKNSKISRFVEKSISRIKTSSRIKEYNKNLSINLQDIHDVRKEILDFLSRICFQFDRDKAIQVNAGFVQTLSNLGHPIYSTNYDYALEFVALENDVKINDNFIQRGQRYLWDKNINFEGIGGLKLIKLHGSVTWYTDGNGTIEKIYSSTSINPAGKKVEQIVIVPTRFKDIYDQHFFALYSHFLNSLAKAKLLIVAGHSLRDDYLRAGIIERMRKGDFQIIVIDPTYPPDIKRELSPAKLGTVGDIVHLPYKWEEISDEISYIMQEAPVGEIIEKCINVLRKQKYTKDKIRIKGNIGVLQTSHTKEIIVDLEAYLTLDNKPSNLRAWLEASYVEADGSKQERITHDFIEIENLQFGVGLSGLIKNEAPMKIKIPKITRWLEEGCKVKLVVGLVRSDIKKPLHVKGKNLIVKVEKELKYKS